MTKKILFTSLILFGFALFGIAEVFFADVSADLEQAKLNVISLIQGGNYAEAEVQTQKLLADFSEHKDIAKAVCQIADEFYKNNKFEQARYLFQYLVDKYPSSEYAMWGQCGVTNSSIRLGEDSTAQTAIDKLIANYSAHKEIALAVCFVADNYRELQKDEKANQVYQRILDKWPDTEDAMWSQQMHIAMSNIRDGNDAAVQAAMDKLIASYAGQKDIAKAVCQVADQYYQLQRHQQADKLYHKVVESCPKGEYSMWSQMHIAMSNIRNGSYAAADIEVDKLLAGYPKDEFMASAVWQIADKYCDSNQYEKANQFYQKVIAGWPDSENPIWRQMAVTILKSQIGDETGANDATDKLITDFAGHPDLPRTLLIIGEGYYEKGLSKESEGPADQARDRFEKAVKMWGRLINEFPNSALIPETCCRAGDCYFKLGKHQESIRCFQKVVDDYPQYEYAWHAQFTVGRCYEELKNAGAVEESVADAHINAAYEQLLKKYPTCAATEIAREWIDLNNSK